MPCFIELNRIENKKGLPAHSLPERTDSPVCMSEAYIFYFHSVNGYKNPASNATYSDSISCYITDIAANTGYRRTLNGVNLKPTRARLVTPVLETDGVNVN